MARPERFARDGVGLAFVARGSGSPVVLLHGFLQSGEREWLRTGLVDAVAGRAALLDARGHGASDRPTEPGAVPSARVGPLMATAVSVIP